MDMFQQAFSMFTPFARREEDAAAAARREAGADRPSDLDELKRQLDEMQKQVDKLSDRRQVELNACDRGAA